MRAEKSKRLEAVVPAPAGPPEPAGPLDLDTLYRSYAAYVAWFAKRLLGRDEEASDVVQEVFVIAAERLHELREPAAIKRWLATVAVRRAGRRLAWKRLRARLGFVADPDYEGVAGRDASPEDQALVGELYRVLGAMPPRERIAWTLRYVHEETMENVATLCRCSLATAKRRVAAAQERIGKEMGRS
jgi:RNA polymerase sigma-70 factor (ECF subfamily)